MHTDKYTYIQTETEQQRPVYEDTYTYIHTYTQAIIHAYIHRIRDTNTHTDNIHTNIQ